MLTPAEFFNTLRPALPMGNTLLKILLIYLITGFLALSYTTKAFAYSNPACPLNTDTITYSDPGGTTCHSADDTTNNAGFNVVGNGTYNTCGQVACPGDNSKTYRYGHTCIRSNTGKCYAGYGSSGFNSTNCTIDQLVPVACPAPMNLNIQAMDEKGIPVSGITFTINYGDAPPGAPAGYTTTATTNQFGKAVVSNRLFSGDHFTIIPVVNSQYVFEPTQYGDETNLGVLEMNTLWSCGTTLGDGTVNDPCLFILHPAGTTFTKPLSCGDCLARGKGSSFYCSNSVTSENLCSPQAFKPYQCTFCQTGGPSPQVAASSTCSQLQGECRPVGNCVSGQEYDLGQLDCTAGYACCGQRSYKPDLTLTLIVFSALAAIGLLF